jgi:hypothetical protein
MSMSAYKPRLELNPTTDNPLVALTTKIENLLAAEPDATVQLAMSALVSAILRIEMVKSDSSKRKAAQNIAHVFERIARTCEN